MLPEQFRRVELDGQHRLYVGRLPDELVPTVDAFELLWSLHPAEYHLIRVHNRTVHTPRWQQAFGRDYEFSGTQSKSLPIHELLAPFLEWCGSAISPALNGMLLNWYDGSLGHYISAHRDSRKNLQIGAPIVTISLGESRTFRLRPFRGNGFMDFDASDGTVFLMPYETNLSWTHEVPHHSRNKGRRISVTVRAFGA